MAIAVEQSTIYVSETSAETDIAATFDTAPTEDNLILIFMGGGNGDETLTEPSGFSTIVANQGTSGQFDTRAIFGKQAGSSEGTTYLVDTDSSGDTFWIVGYEISGAVTSSWNDVSDDVWESGPTTPFDLGTTATTSQANELAVAAGALWESGATIDVTGMGSSFTLDEELNETGGWDVIAFAGSKVLSSTQTVNTDAAFTSSADSGHGIIVTIKELGSQSETTSGTINGGGGLSASVTATEDQIARPASTIAAGDWDTGPTTGQNLHTYTSDGSDATYIEDTTV